MIPFTFTRISQRLIEDLTAIVCEGESAVLLGPRFCGKLHVIEEVLRSLERQNIGLVLSMCDIRSKPLASSDELSGRLSEAIRRLGYDPPAMPTQDVFASLDWLCRATGQIVYLIVANVDGMAHHVARLFLQGLRVRVAARRLVVLLSGEYDFRDLVHGPDSEFNTAHRYFLQGLAEDTFSHFFNLYTSASTLSVDCPDDVCRHLWDLTGGAGYLLRLLLASSMERRARTGEWNKVVVAGEFTWDLDSANAPMPYSAGVLGYSTRLISGASECWQELEALLANRIVEVPLMDSPPGPLEFSGIVIRDTARRRLVWASPILEQMIRAHYNPRRLADLYARANQWEEAFTRYSRLPAQERIRPFDFDDRLDSEHAVNSLCATFHAEVEKGPDHLRKRFVDGARLLLGFPDLSHWLFDRTWSPVDPQLPPDELKLIAQLLPVGELVPEGWLPLPEPYNAYAAVALLPDIRPGRHTAILVGDLGDRTAISRERERLLRKLVSHFVTAHRRAVIIEAARRRLEVRDHQREVLTSIGDTLSKNVLDVRQVLRMAAEGLRKLGYYRVQFCFVDARRERIKGVVDLNDDPNCTNVASMTDWPLKPPTADIQPYVVYTKTFKIVPDPRLEPLINPLVLLAAKLRPLAIVPILNRNQIVIGTIHVERADSAIPIYEEVQDLLFFGRQLAAIIEQSERVRLLQDALDKIPSPVALVDLDRSPLYANRPAADLFDVPAAWRDPDVKPSTIAKWGGKVHQDLGECLQQGQRIVHHYTGIGTRSDYRGTVLCDKIDNWQGSTAAAVLHVEDLNYLETVFESFGSVARSNDTESACQNLLDVCLQLGAKWARLYFIDEHDPNLLVGRLWVGEGEEPYRSESPRAVTFKRGVDPEFGWLAMDTRTPQVFCYKPSGREGERFRTPAGLQAVVVSNPPTTPYAPKTPDGFWIDLPLCTPDHVIGKVTLDCEAQLLPEKFEMLNVLSNNTATQLV